MNKYLKDNNEFVKYGAPVFSIPEKFVGEDKNHHLKLYKTITKKGNISHHLGEAAIHFKPLQDNKAKTKNIIDLDNYDDEIFYPNDILKKKPIKAKIPSPPSSPSSSSSSSSSSEAKPLSKTKSLSLKSKNALHEIKKRIMGRVVANKFKNFMNLFMNRISANLEKRIEYTVKFIEKINEIDLDKNLEFIKQIGTPSEYGIVFLTRIKGTYFKCATKIMRNTKDNLKEAEILDKLSSLVVNNINPHFPILYIALLKKPNDLNIPNTFRNKPCIELLSELADGDLKTFLPSHYKDTDIIINAFQQIYISVLSFHKYTNLIHGDSHWGNFLFHKIKAGGYIHYKIFEVDVYLKNYGFLWVIWDYSFAKESIIEFKKDDYKRITNAFINYSDRGWFPDNKKYNDDIKNFVKIIKVIQRKSLNDEQMFISFFKASLFNTVKPPNNEIINFGMPYEIK